MNMRLGMYSIVIQMLAVMQAIHVLTTDVFISVSRGNSPS